jgi:hypothetical protein
MKQTQNPSPLVVYTNLMGRVPLRQLDTIHIQTIGQTLHQGRTNTHWQYLINIMLIKTNSPHR